MAFVQTSHEVCARIADVCIVRTRQRNDRENIIPEECVFDE